MLRMRRCMSISDNQFGFMLERSRMKTIHLIRQMIEYYRLGKETCTWFLLTLNKYTRYQEK